MGGKGTGQFLGRALLDQSFATGWSVGSWTGSLRCLCCYLIISSTASSAREKPVQGLDSYCRAGNAPLPG